MILEVIHNLDVVRGTVIRIYDLSLTFRANGHHICDSGWKDLERNPLNWGCLAVKPQAYSY